MTCCSYWAHMMAEPTLARLVGERFDHVLVDEYQDTNALQAQILLGMKLRHPNVCSVLDWGMTAQGKAYLVMDLLTGESLMSVIKAQAPMPRGAR